MTYWSMNQIQCEADSTKVSAFRVLEEFLKTGRNRHAINDQDCTDDLEESKALRTPESAILISEDREKHKM